MVVDAAYKLLKYIGVWKEKKTDANSTGETAHGNSIKQDHRDIPN